MTQPAFSPNSLHRLRAATQTHSRRFGRWTGHTASAARAFYQDPIRPPFGPTLESRLPHTPILRLLEVTCELTPAQLERLAVDTASIEGGSEETTSAASLSLAQRIGMVIAAFFVSAVAAGLIVQL